MFCVKCKKNTHTEEPTEEFTAKNGRLCRRGKCVVCSTRKTSFIRGGRPKKVEDGAVMGEGLPVDDAERPEMEKYAKFASSTYIPVEEREEFLKKEGMEGFLLDKELSDVENTVFYNPDSKEMVYGARGSVAAKDWLVDDALIATGATNVFNYAPRYRSTKKRIEEARSKYGDYKHHLTGHSLGSTLISTAGSDMKIPFHGFSTGSSPAGWGKSMSEKVKNMFNPNRKKWLTANAKTYNVWTDPVSISDTIFPIWNTKHYNINKKKGVPNPHSILNFYSPTGGGVRKLKKHAPYMN